MGSWFPAALGSVHKLTGQLGLAGQLDRTAVEAGCIHGQQLGLIVPVGELQGIGNGLQDALCDIAGQ